MELRHSSKKPDEMDWTMGRTKDERSAKRVETKT